MLKFYLPYLPLSNLLYFCNVIIKILNVMSTENYSNLVSEIDLGKVEKCLNKCDDYFVTKLVYDDGSIKYRVCYLENGLNSISKELLFDDIHAVLDFIAYN